MLNSKLYSAQKCDAYSVYSLVHVFISFPPSSSSFRPSFGSSHNALLRLPTLTTTVEVCEEQRHLTVDEAGVYMPPDKLQVPDTTPFSNSDSALSGPESDEAEEDESSDSSAPEYSTNDDTGRDKVPPHPDTQRKKTRPAPLHTQRPVTDDDGGVGVGGPIPSPKSRTPPRPPPPGVGSPGYRSSGGTPPMRRDDGGVFRYDNVSPGKKDDGVFRYDSGRVTPTRSHTPRWVALYFKFMGQP